ncbi:Protoplast secreted protein 2 [Leucoagaricus sp. SymC.cos]|nr:Protoplast secreted protein 2 [Leucoagaricus sp. SymC.cos]
MCFPSKRQKDNFTDEATKTKPSNTQNGSDGKDTKAEKSEAPATTTTTPPAPAAPSTVPASATNDNMSAPRLAIIIYTMYGHVGKMAEYVKEGVVKAGGKADIFQVPETLSSDVLGKLHAPPKPEYPVFDYHKLPDYDAYLFGVPTRYGNMPAQWKAFWDATGGLWMKSALAGKYAGAFVSTGTPGGGQEVTVLNLMSTLAHHGIIFVPLGYKAAYAEVTNLTEVHGGSPWGAGTFAGGDGSRQPTVLEAEIARKQGTYFWEVISKVKFQ